jgi:hypothetical protein
VAAAWRGVLVRRVWDSGSFDKGVVVIDEGGEVIDGLESGRELGSTGF